MDNLHSKQAELKKVVDFLKKSKGVTSDGIARNIGMSPNAFTLIVNGHRENAEKVEAITKAIKSHYAVMLSDGSDYDVAKIPKHTLEKDKLSIIMDDVSEVKALLKELIKKSGK